MKVELSGLSDALGQTPETFICAAGFEDRSRSVAEQLDPNNVKNVIVLENGDFHAYVARNSSIIKERFKNTLSVPLRTDNPLFVADALKSKVLPLISSSTGLCLIDITTLTHEQLLIFIRLLTELSPLPKTTLAYTGADEYSVNSSREDKWLTKGVAEIRAVLGYPGIMLPSRRLHLIVLVGFEHERAEKLIEQCEPALISLGLGRKDQSVSSKHHATNADFHERVRKSAEGLSTSIVGVHQFEFSCVDPQTTMMDVIAQADKFVDHNVAVCPMNTKPSTIGAALAGLKKEHVQLIYAQPIEYNIDGYSTPGHTCTIFDLAECLIATTSESVRAMKQMIPRLPQKSRDF